MHLVSFFSSMNNVNKTMNTSYAIKIFTSISLFWFVDIIDCAERLSDIMKRHSSVKKQLHYN